jgi:ribosome-binding protein aMBF1 (putative translation factor)
MAREVVESKTCDICGEESAYTYTISKPGAFVLADLCATHAAPIEEAFARGSQAPRKSQARPKRPPAHEFIPLD